jgi:lysyl-tRNA synthetase class 2
VSTDPSSSRPDDAASPGTAVDPQADERLVAERRARLAALREHGNAYPNDFDRTHLAGPLQQAHEAHDKAALEAAPVRVSVAGRIMLKRVMGKASFATIRDGSGSLQLYVSIDHAGAQAHEAFKHYDLGDIVGASGTLFRTRTGELTVDVTDVRLLTKSLRPMPEKYHGLTDQEQRYRQRYLDLMVNEESRQVFLARSRTVQAVRDFLIERDYLEVETPMMHPIPGGANARPFITHHNALDMQLYLRIAPELYLKRLVVGGFERVFEINRNFRNEGISTRHNPEFTMLEFYAAYTDYRHLMSLTEQMLAEVARRVTGSSTVSYQGRSIDFAKPFDRLTIVEAIARHAPGYTPAQLADRDWLLAELARLGEKVHPEDGIGGLQLSLFEATVESQLFDPTFIIDYPAEVSPLARRSDRDASITDRFELFIAGREIANGFSELNDPEVQARVFREQASRKEAGDAEAMHYDADYVRALEYGLPPCGGEGIGIDRLVMLLTDRSNIRDVILFPQMRRED